MTNKNNEGPGDHSKGRLTHSDHEAHPKDPQTRSLSLKDALAALGEVDDPAIDQGAAASGVSSIVSGAQPDLNASETPPIPMVEVPVTTAGADGASAAARGEGSAPKTRIFGGSDEDLKYYQDPVVGWLVIVEGPGIGAFRPIFIGSNTIGSDPGQRIPIDFGDEFISREEQAYIRYDTDDRQFLFIPNLAKTNVVSIDNVKPTSAVRMMPYDIISMGDTRLVFIPFCGEEFDWSDLPLHKK